MPRVVRDTQCLSFHEVTLAELEPAGFALREPPAAAPEVPLAEIGAFVVPGLAFDRAGGARLGWGRGYYDATLAAAPAARRIGLAFEVQLVDGLAHDAHDVAMNLIVTEVATYVVA